MAEVANHQTTITTSNAHGFQVGDIIFIDLPMKVTKMPFLDLMEHIAKTKLLVTSITTSNFQVS